MAQLPAPRPGRRHQARHDVRQRGRPRGRGGPARPPRQRAAGPRHPRRGARRDRCGATRQCGWIIDPIDGTANYVRGVPVWATLIALERRRRDRRRRGVGAGPGPPVVGGAGRGRVAWRSGDPIHVSKVAARRGRPSCRRAGTEMLHDARLQPLARRCWRTRGFGDFWSAHARRRGRGRHRRRTRLRVGPGPPVRHRRGGRRSLHVLGGDRSLDGGNVVATNGLLHDEVLEALS